MINYDLNNFRDDYEQRLAQRKQFFNPENGDAPSMQSLEDSSRITNMGLLVKASIVLTFTVLLFFLQNIPQLNLSLGWTALLGAITLLILADTGGLYVF